MANSFFRTFRLPDAVMLEAAELFHSLYMADELKFMAFNPITFYLTFKDDFLAEIHEARRLGTDSYIVARQSSETEIVTAKVGECSTHYIDLKYFVKRAFAGNAEIYSQFGFNDFQQVRLSPTKMELFLEVVFNTATEYKAQLIANGYSQAKIDRLKELKDELMQVHLNQEDLKKTRPVMTRQRIESLNKVWERVVNIHQAAKLIFSDSYAKFHEYDLPKRYYKKQPTVATPPPDTE